MIERRRLDESIISRGWAVVIGAAWFVSVLLLPSSIYGFNQLEANSLLPKILIVLCIVGAVVSFMVAVPGTAVITWAVYRYLKYSKVAATLIVRTDRPSYRPGDDVRVSISVETDQTLLTSSGKARLRLKFYNEGLGFSTLSESSLRPWGEQNLSPGDSHEWTAVLSLPADAIMGHPKREQISIVLDVSLKTSPRTDATVELVVLEADSPREDADQSKLKTARPRNLDLSRPLERTRTPARFAWFEWLEHTGRQPTLEWKDDPVDSVDRFVWIASGDIWCANDPVRRVEFRFMRTDGGDWIFNEVSVHLEAGWAQ